MNLKGKIDKDGFLCILRKDVMKKQFCPYVSDVWGCGDWCPMFSCEFDLFSKATVSLCHKKFIIEPMIDER